MKVDMWPSVLEVPGYCYCADSALFLRPENCVTVAIIKMDCKQYCNYCASVHTV